MGLAFKGDAGDLKLFFQSTVRFFIYLFLNQVQYDVRGILEKNRDTFRDDLLNLLRESRYVHLQPNTSLASKVLFVQMLLIYKQKNIDTEAAQFIIFFHGQYFISKMTKI